jgi:hypothetical protein
MEANGNNETDHQILKSAKPKSTLINIACATFLLVSFGLWFLSGGSWIVMLLLFLPCYVCGEWLSRKIFHERSRLSVANSGFSLLRIVLGVLVVCLFFAAAYGLYSLFYHFFY